jgi:hypothetical protein
MSDNVVPIKSPEADFDDPDEVQIQIRRAFDVLYSDYLKARARFHRSGLSDRELEALGDKLDDLTWDIIRFPAPLEYHLNYKFEIMRELMDKRFVDGRHRAMLESIRNDVINDSGL